MGHAGLHWALLATAIFASDPVEPTEAKHIVPTEVAQLRLLEAGAEREQDLASVDAALAMPETERAARMLRLDIDAIRTICRTLDDDALHLIGARTRALTASAQRGQSSGMITANSLLALAIIVVVALLVALRYAD